MGQFLPKSLPGDHRQLGIGGIRPATVTGSFRPSPATAKSSEPALARLDGGASPFAVPTGIRIEGGSKAARGLVTARTLWRPPLERIALRSTDRPAKAGFRMDEDDQIEAVEGPRTTGAQSIMRAIDILDAVAAAGTIMLPDLVKAVGLNEKTCYRLASALVERGLLSTSGRKGFRLGYRAAELGAAYERHRRTI